MLLNTALKVETVAALVLAWILVFVMPIRWVTGMFAAPAPAGDGAGDGMPPRPPASGGARAAAVARRVNRLAGAMPFSTTCLVKAVAGALLLRRRGMCDITIRFGVRKTGGTLDAHAWLIHDGVVLLGGGVALESYAPLADLSVVRAAPAVRPDRPDVGPPAQRRPGPPIETPRQE